MSNPWDTSPTGVGLMPVRPDEPSGPWSVAVQFATFERVREQTTINGVQVTWTTWRPVRTENAE